METLAREEQSGEGKGDSRTRRELRVESVRGENRGKGAEVREFRTK